MTRPRGEMSDELFHKIIKEGKEIRNSSFLPFLNGEPFVFPRIWEWLAYLRDEKVKVNLYTNAEFLDVNRVIKYPNIVSICCSVNAATKDTYDKVMRGPNYDVVKSNVEDLFNKAPFKVIVSMVIVDENQHEVEMFRKMWGKNVKLVPFKNWGGIRHCLIEKTGKRKICKALLRSISILWDGRVVPCCMDYDGKMILGDINKQTLMEVWKQSRWLRKCNRQLDFSMIPCRDCNHNI